MKKERVNHADIIIMNDNNLGYVGGERESQRIIIQAASQKYKVAVVQPGEYDENIPNTEFYYRTKARRMKFLIKNPIAFVAYIFKVGKLINKIQPKVIHTQSQVCFFIVSLLRRLHLISRKTMFIHTDRGLYTKYNTFFKKLFLFSFKYLDMLITTTEFNKVSWKEANEEKHIHLAYKVIGNTAGDIYESIDMTKIPENRDYLTIGFAGRYCDWKGWPLAEEICKKVNSKSPKTHFSMMVGCFDEKDEINTQKMFDRMTALYGDRFNGKINVPFEDMEEFYYDIDVYILTSWKKSESFGRTIVEAMSRMTAVLTTDAGGSVEVVNKPYTVCDKAKDFASMILKWEKSPEELKQEKEVNFKRAHDVYSLDQNISNYMMLYDESMKNLSYKNKKREK